MALAKSKKPVAISMPIEKYKELKKIAIDYDMTLSQLLTTAGTIADPEEIKKVLQDSRGVPPTK